MDYFEPKSVDEALSLLGRYGEQARVIAGGTDVLVDMKFKEEPEYLLNIKRIPDLSYIKEDGASIRIGPLTTIHEIETSRIVKEKLPVLWEACHQFASLQIRNTATIGGNICRASPSGETLAPLLVLNAVAEIVFSEGAERIPMEALFLGPGQTKLRSKGLLKQIEVPYPPAGSASVYLKHAVRGAMDIAMVGVGVLIVPDSTLGTIKEARIGLGAVAPTPIRAKKAEATLRGKPLSATLAQEAAKIASSESSPISDQRSSAEYRGWIVEALTRRGLEQCWKAATGKEIAR